MSNVSAPAEKATAPLPTRDQCTAAAGRAFALELAKMAASVAPVSEVAA